MQRCCQRYAIYDSESPLSRPSDCSGARCVYLADTKDSQSLCIVLSIVTASELRVALHMNGMDIYFPDIYRAHGAPKRTNVPKPSPKLFRVCLRQYLSGGGPPWLVNRITFGNWLYSRIWLRRTWRGAHGHCVINQVSNAKQSDYKLFLFLENFWFVFLVKTRQETTFIFRRQTIEYLFYIMKFCLVLSFFAESTLSKAIESEHHIDAIGVIGEIGECAKCSQYRNTIGRTI